MSCMNLCTIQGYRFTSEACLHVILHDGIGFNDAFSCFGSLSLKQLIRSSTVLLAVQYTSYVVAVSSNTV